MKKRVVKSRQIASQDLCDVIKVAAQRDVLLPKLISGELHASQLACERSIQK